MRRIIIGVVALLLSAPAARAQGLRGKISDLFIFGPGQQPLFLAGSGDPNNPVSIQVHGNHFIPAASAGNATVIDFVTSSISANVANVPLSATSGGATFRFEGGMPVKTSTSPGPVFGERGQTLGRGRVQIGLTHTSLHFATLRGVPLNDIHLNFTHENTDFPGCDTLFGGDCSKMGIPSLENDVIQFQLGLDVDLAVNAFAVTYGLSNSVDLGFVLPLVSTSLHGESDAQIVPFGSTTEAVHFFAGTPTAPVLSASRSVSGSATGLGDLAVRLKANVHNTDRLSMAFLADARFPTGDAENLLGSGKFAARGLGIMSATMGSFSPHLNVGYLYRVSELQNNAVLATIGFDQMLAPWVTQALDVVSELQVGGSKLVVPGTVVIEAPFRRSVQPTDIPDMRDDIVNASYGFKFTAAENLTVVTNAIWPLNRGGLRPNIAWSGGLEYSF